MRTQSKKQTTVPTITFPEPLLVTTKKAACLLSVSPWEVRRLIRKGVLTHKSLGKTSWLVTMKSIRAYAEERS